jgi:hypothetical protein
MELTPFLNDHWLQLVPLKGNTNLKLVWGTSLILKAMEMCIFEKRTYSALCRWKTQWVKESECIIIWADA